MLKIKSWIESKQNHSLEQFGQTYRTIMKWGLNKKKIFIILSIILQNILIITLYNEMNCSTSFHDELIASKNKDDEVFVRIFASSTNDCWMTAFFNILYRMKEFHDFLNDLDDEAFANEPLLVVLKRLQENVSPLRETCLQLKDVGNSICNHLDPAIFKYGRRNNTVNFAKYLIRYLADFDIHSQYFVISSQKPDWYMYHFRQYFISSRKGIVLTNLLAQKNLRYTETSGNVIYKVDKWFRKELRYPKILIIVPFTLYSFQENIIKGPICDRLIIYDKIVYHLKGIICRNTKKTHAFSMAYIDGKLYKQDRNMRAYTLDEIKSARMLVFSLEIE